MNNVPASNVPVSEPVTPSAPVSEPVTQPVEPTKS
jgi:hypothetical protein